MYAQAHFNQLDHIVINRKVRRRILDIRGMKGEDIVSEHRLVRAKLKNRSGLKT